MGDSVVEWVSTEYLYGEHGVLIMGEHGVLIMSEHGVLIMGEHRVPRIWFIEWVSTEYLKYVNAGVNKN